MRPPDLDTAGVGRTNRLTAVQSRIEPAELASLHTVGPAAELAGVWDAIRTGLRRDCGSRTFDNWLGRARLGIAGDALAGDGGAVRLVLPSQFLADQVEQNFGDRLRLAWRAMLPGFRELSIGVAPEDGIAEPVVVRELGGDAEPTAPSLFDPRYRFDTFVIGKANEGAATAARTLATADNLAFNPLFIHGGTGRGKTHLLHAIGQAFGERRPGAKVLAMSAERFMIEFVGALRENATLAFKQHLRSADLLLIDDVQFIAGKESTQEEFFHTMNEIIGAGRRLVITSDRAPQDLDGIAPRILSRLSWGLVADVNPADYELRLNIVAKKLEALPDVRVPPEVVQFLAKRISSNVRELEGALHRIAAYATMTGRAIDLAFTEEVLANILRANQRQVSVDEIQTRVAEHFKIRKAEMTSARRAREVARPRQVAMYLSKQLTPRSLPDIGRRFGGRDHTTVIHAVKQIEKLRAADAELDGDIRLLTRQLEG